jgi:exopolyphosphatase/guanosine-5'-triphosphate,3'-diphosphate pyrophosphatase
MPQQNQNEMAKFAAIDIGSNAVKLLLAKVFEDGDVPIVKKESFVRIPIRLGDDAFTQKRVSDQKVEKLVSTLIGFKHLIQAYQPVSYAACATSALRESINGSDIITKIKETSGIDVEIVDGPREAEIICANHSEQAIGNYDSFLYIDVGGGSTELTFFSGKKKSGKKKISSRSFPVGTVRILKEMVKDTSWKAMKKWLVSRTSDAGSITAIGSGGNINKVFSLSRKEEGKPLTYKLLKSTYRFLDSYTIEERIKILGLRPDRADVIIPALRIFLTVMKWTGIKKIYVPQIGLSDGLVHILHQQYRTKN